MARRCTICASLDRLAIEQELRDETRSLSKLAAAYGLSKTSLLRHRDRHMAAEPVQRGARTPEPAPLFLEGAAPTVPTSPASEPIDEATAAFLLDQRRSKALMMRARGISAVAIARALDVSDRTVREWWAEARDEQIARVRAETAETLVARIIGSHDQRARDIYHIADRAKADGDLRAALAALRQLREDEHATFDRVHTVGAFDRFRRAGAASDDAPGAQSARFIQESLAEIAAIFSGSPVRPDWEACLIKHEAGETEGWRSASDPA
ncbi:helix-turn-helix domain-containing protein [Salinarimonas rosea]|uniref:helix-turn-helix domain-containing protein n=1 Tax=Salinarimonas rosea TaxID=552063 RepID=UPI000429A3E4|nr:helix-turn-helix domain-containing protein [Salinarimonas rosea]